jgi:hypothetical protein
MRFPDFADTDDVIPSECRIWLTVLLGAMGDQSEHIVALLPDEATQAVLIYLVSMLNAEEANFGAPWRRVLHLE